MSIRIQNDGISGAGASQINPADHLTVGGGGRGSASVGSPSDHVEISSLSEGIASASASLDAQRADKLNRLATLFAQGQYQIDPVKISRSLISSSLNAGAMEGGD